MADPTWWDEMNSMRRVMDRFWDPIWGPSWGVTRNAGIHSFPLGLYETDEGFEICGLLPGVRPEDLDITVQGNMLTISGERKADEQLKASGVTCHFNEIPYGRFTRRMTLPTAVEVDGVDAKVDNGILVLRLHKAAEARARRTQVRQGAPQIGERAA